MIGLPDRTVRDWKQKGVDGDMSKADEDTVKAVRPEMIRLASQIVTAGATIVAEQLENLRESRTEWKPSELRDITVVSGIWVDKMRLLSVDQIADTPPQVYPTTRENPLVIVPPSQAKADGSA